MKVNRIATAIVAASTLLVASAQAATVSWTNWSNTFTSSVLSGVATGTTSPVAIGVTYNGEVDSIQANYPSWTPASTFADGILVDNAPPQSGGIVKIKGGPSASINTVTFDTPVVNPVFSIWSLGQNGAPTSFVFNTSSFVLVSGGPSSEYAGLPITKSTNIVGGVEGNGTVVFQGTFSSISWTNPQFEDWYGFTVGVNGGNAIPLPTAALAGLSLLCLTAFKSRTRRQANP